MFTADLNEYKCKCTREVHQDPHAILTKLNKVENLDKNLTKRMLSLGRIAENDLRLYIPC